MTAALRQNSAKGAVYFEIRAGTEAVDPLKWLANKH
jgi:septal ring factor EnvC (AmiA/AmiB activator)